MTGSDSPLTLNSELLELAAVTVTLAPVAVRLPDPVALSPATTLPSVSVAGETPSWASPDEPEPDDPEPDDPDPDEPEPEDPEPEEPLDPDDPEPPLLTPWHATNRLNPARQSNMPVTFTRRFTGKFLCAVSSISGTSVADV